MSRAPEISLRWRVRGAFGGSTSMERKKASDFPQELLNLFDLYVHGDIHRREFLDGAQKFAVGGVTVAALLEMLRPNYAWAIQVPENDSRIKAETATVQSPKGNGASAATWSVRPARAESCPWFWLCMRTAASIRTSRMLRAGWRSRTSWHSLPIASPPWGATPAMTREVESFSPNSIAAR